MLAYPIKLKNFTDFQKLASLFDEVTCSGFITGSGFRVEADDILALVSRYPLDNLYLVLEERQGSKTSSVEQYLAGAGLTDHQR